MHPPDEGERSQALEYHAEFPGKDCVEGSSTAEQSGFGTSSSWTEHCDDVRISARDQPARKNVGGRRAAAPAEDISSPELTARKVSGSCSCTGAHNRSSALLLVSF